MNQAKDILDEMSKDELVLWIRNHHLSRPKRSEVLYLRWKKQSDDLMRDWRAHTVGRQGIDLTERDRLAVAFNNSTDMDEKMRLLEKIKPYDDALRIHRQSYEALCRREKKVDKLYEQIDVERVKEGRR